MKIKCSFEVVYMNYHSKNQTTVLYMSSSKENPSSFKVIITEILFFTWYAYFTVYDKIAGILYFVNYNMYLDKIRAVPYYRPEVLRYLLLFFSGLQQCCGRPGDHETRFIQKFCSVSSRCFAILSEDIQSNHIIWGYLSLLFLLCCIR